MTFSYCERDELSHYEGRKSFVVMQGWFAGGPDFLPSDKLWPVYVGTHMTVYNQNRLLNFLKYNPEYFTGHEIGCRDHRTMRFFQTINVPAYLSRCLTLTLPKRTVCPEVQKTVFLVNVPDEALKYIPESIRENAVVINQRNIKEGNCERANFYNSAGRYMEQASSLLARYSKEAALVITTAVHCASPCTAMGIPVVLLDMENNTADRFDFLNGIIPIWNKEDLAAGRVDYSPVAPDIESLKNDMLTNLRLTLDAELGKPVDRQELLQVRSRIEAFRVL